MKNNTEQHIAFVLLYTHTHSCSMHNKDKSAGTDIDLGSALISKMYSYVNLLLLPWRVFINDIVLTKPSKTEADYFCCWIN